MELALIVILYLLPSIVASVRQHHQAGSITVINLFLGWTLVFWVIALAMSVSAKKEVVR